MKDLDSALREAKRLGVSGVQIYATTGEFSPESLTSEKKEHYKALLSELGLEVSALCGDMGGYGFEKEEDNPERVRKTKEIIDFAMDFVKPYGYVFEHEATYDRLCLVNGSTYIAKYASTEWCQSHYGYVPGDNVKAEKKGEIWTATAKQFQVPYVFKTLFSKEPIEFKDLCEAKEVKTAIYIDMNEDLPEGEHDYHFVGKIGNFCPIKPGCGGGVLVRENKSEDGRVKYDSVTGTLKPDKTPYRWLESEAVKMLGKESDIDKSYYRKLVDDAIEAISEHGDFERFVADEPYGPIAGIDFPPDEDPPWYTDEELREILARQERDLDDTFRKR